MDPSTLHSFGGELAKTAVSARLALAVLRRTVARGAKVAPKLLRKAEAAAATGAKSTPKSLRKLTLASGENVRAAKGARTLASRQGVSAQRAAFRSRGRQVDKALRVDPKSVTAPVSGGNILTRGYSPGASNFMTGRGTLAQAQAATRANPTPLLGKGISAPRSSGATTAIGTRVARPQVAGNALRPPPMTPKLKTVPGIGGVQTQLSTVGSNLSGPAAAYQSTVLSKIRPRV